MAFGRNRNIIWLKVEGASARETVHTGHSQCITNGAHPSLVWHRELGDWLQGQKPFVEPLTGFMASIFLHIMACFSSHKNIPHYDDYIT